MSGDNTVISYTGLALSGINSAALVYYWTRISELESQVASLTTKLSDVNVNQSYNKTNITNMADVVNKLSQEVSKCAEALNGINTRVIALESIAACRQQFNSQEGRAPSQRQHTARVPSFAPNPTAQTRAPSMTLTEPRKVMTAEQVAEDLAKASSFE